MADLGLDPEQPHHVPQSVVGRRRNLIVTLYTECRNQSMGAAGSLVLLVLMLLSMALVGLALRGRPKKKGA